MNKLTITITMTDPEELEWLSTRTEDEIIEEVIDDPVFWFDGAEIEVVKE